MTGKPFLLQHNLTIRTAAIALLTAAVAVAGLWEATVGLCQLTGWLRSAHYLYPATGSFYNPGPFGGYIGMALPIWLFLWFKCRAARLSLPECGCLVAGMLMVFMLAVSGSRAGMLACGAGCFTCIWLMEPRGAWRERLKKTVAPLRGRRAARYMLIAAALLTATFAGAGAYLMKKESADGRVLMWKIATHAVSENPSGVGWYQVAGAYGDAQERYFASGKGSANEAMVAGSPEYVFNEYLQVALAWGVPAMLLFIALIVAGIWLACRTRSGAPAGALVAFAVFAFASYPLQFAIFRWSLAALLFAAFISALPAGKKSMILIGLSAPAASVALFAMQHADNEMKKASDEYNLNAKFLYSAGASRQYIEKVKQLTGSETLTLDDTNHTGELLKKMPGFMFDYGRALHLEHHYDESNYILEHAMKISSDPMILNLIAKNYMAKGDNAAAEKWLRRSINRLPSRMYPHYLLCRLYATDRGHYEGRLRQEVEIIRSMPVKVKSPAVETMRKEVKNLLEDR